MWDRNPKSHDIGGLMESIWRHGFVDAPKYDAALNAIVFGNGRLLALARGRAVGKKPPRGIKLARNGTWLVPIKFGVDQTSRAEAEALGLGHNNLTLSGGDFTAIDMARLWSKNYLPLLRTLEKTGHLPVTVDGEALAALTRAAQRDQPLTELPDLEDPPADLICPKCGQRIVSLAPAAGK